MVAADLQQAEQHISEREYVEALTLLRRHWLENPLDRQAARLMSRLMKAQGRSELSGALYKLAESDVAMEEDTQNLFEAGFALIDERELQLAVMLLERCAAKVPDEPVIAYELGFALMSLHQFERAIGYFETAVKANPDFDTHLNLCVCHTLCRDGKKAAASLAILEKMADNEEQRLEVAHRQMVLKRFDLLKSKPSLGVRDWMFILYGSILMQDPALEDLRKSIRTGTFPGLSFENESEETRTGYRDVAWTLMVLDKVLAELGCEFDVIEFYSPESRPLAEVMSHLLNLPARSFAGEDSKDRALMLMSWAPNIIGPHKSFTANSGKRVLFAYGLSALQPLPLTPEVVGEISLGCTLPWVESSDEETEFAPRESFDLPDQRQARAIDRLLQEIAELESRPEIIKQVQEITDYYKPKRHLIVLDNPKNFPQRPEYTAETTVQ